MNAVSESRDSGIDPHLKRRIVSLKPRLHIHGFLYDSPRFTPISHGQKNRDGNIQCHYDSNKNVYDISTVSVRYRYVSMTIYDGNATANED